MQQVSENWETRRSGYFGERLRFVNGPRRVRVTGDRRHAPPRLHAAVCWRASVVQGPGSSGSRTRGDARAPLPDDAAEASELAAVQGNAPRRRSRAIQRHGHALGSTRNRPVHAGWTLEELDLASRQLARQLVLICSFTTTRRLYTFYTTWRYLRKVQIIRTGRLSLPSF